MYVSYLTDIGNHLSVFTRSNDSRIGMTWREGFQGGANAPPPNIFSILKQFLLDTEFKIDKYKNRNNFKTTIWVL